MTMKTEIASVTVASLQNITSAGTALGLESIIERKEHGGGIPRYRIYRVSDETPVTTIAELLAEITEPNIHLGYSLTGQGKELKDKCKPITVILSSVVVKWEPMSDEDSTFTSVFGKDSDTIGIVMMYLGDADTVLPIKAVDITLFKRKGE